MKSRLRPGTRKLYVRSLRFSERSVAVELFPVRAELAAPRSASWKRYP
jgi:hypothetical protein